MAFTKQNAHTVEDESVKKIVGTKNLAYNSCSSIIKLAERKEDSSYSESFKEIKRKDKKENDNKVFLVR